MNKLKRPLAAFLSILLMLGAFVFSPGSASAADMTVSITSTGWNKGAAPNLWNGGTISGGADSLILYIRPDTMLYCLEPGAPLMGGDSMDMNSYVGALRTPSIHEDATAARLLSRMFQYIDYGQTGSPLATDEGKALYLAAQILTWEVTQGERDADFNYVSPPAGYDRVRQYVDNSSMPAVHKDAVIGWYDHLVGKVQSHHTVPSFSRLNQESAPVFEMTDDEDAFSITLKDESGVLPGYNFTANGKISLNKDGNNLVVTAKDYFPGEITITATSSNTKRKGVVCYGDGAGGRQDTAAVGSPVDDPVSAYFKLKIATGKIRITKQDVETGKAAQGDAALTGAVFDVLDKRGRPADRIYCTSDTFATTKELPFGRYTIREVTPPAGYTLSAKEYPVTIGYATKDKTTGLVLSDVGNTVIKGRVQLVKHADTPDMSVNPENEQVQRPLSGIVFEVYLKSAGSYEKAKESERDLLTTDENGYAKTKDLPYGVYAIKEVKGEGEHNLCEPFDVFIAEDGRTYYFNVENTVYFGKVKIVKVDSETGKTIPQPGIEFKIKDADTGKWVEQEILYPTPVVIDSYLTAPDGTLVMPSPLENGNYELHEVVAPHGYVLSDTPVPFTVTPKNPVEFLEVKMPNAPVKGKVSVQKTGEVLSKATEVESKHGKIYVPEYEIRGIEGATFDVIATSDVVTPDGTLRAEAGEVVDTITTNANGTATSKELYLGNYHAIERTVPHGFLLDETPLSFSLVYKDQHTALVSSEVGLFNARTKGEIRLTKTAEEVKINEDGNISYVQTPARDIVFGMYARTDILNADGKVVVAAGSLIDVLTTNSDGYTVSTVDIPFGAYFVKELISRPSLVPSDKEYDVTFEYKDGKTPLVSISVNDGKAVENHLIKGKIKVIKTDEDKKPLSGVEFLVKGTNTGITIKLTTDKDGVAKTGVLPYGLYTIVETKTQDGYVLDENQHTILLAKDGEVYEFGFINKKIPEKPVTPSEPVTSDNPKTGDDRNIGLWLVLAGISLASLTALGIYGKRKRHRKDETDGN